MLCACQSVSNFKIALVRKIEQPQEYVRENEFDIVIWIHILFILTLAHDICIVEAALKFSPIEFNKCPEKIKKGIGRFE